MVDTGTRYAYATVICFTAAALTARVAHDASPAPFEGGWLPWALHALFLILTGMALMGAILSPAEDSEDSELAAILGRSHGKRCAECGEDWPCTDSSRRDIDPRWRALHCVNTHTRRD